MGIMEALNFMVNNGFLTMDTSSSIYVFAKLMIHPDLQNAWTVVSCFSVNILIPISLSQFRFIQGAFLICSLIIYNFILPPAILFLHFSHK